MPEVWMTVAQAATVLKVHPRTIERRISSGKIECRRSDHGNVEVSIPMPDTIDMSERNASRESETLETVKELADRQVDIAAGSASALVRIAQQTADRAQEDLVLVRQDLDFARQDLSSARRESRAAWAVVGGMMILIMLAIGWATHSMTRTSADVRQLADRLKQAETSVVRGQASLDQAKASVRQAEQDRYATSEQLTQARVAQAKAQGELEAYKTELASRMIQTTDVRPTTRPTGLMARLASAFAD